MRPHPSMSMRQKPPPTPSADEEESLEVPNSRSILNDQHPCSSDGSRLESLQCLVRFFESETLRTWANRNCCRLPQQIFAILSRIRRHTPQHSLTEQVPVIIQ